MKSGISKNIKKKLFLNSDGIISEHNMEGSFKLSLLIVSVPGRGVNSSGYPSVTAYIIILFFPKICKDK